MPATKGAFIREAHRLLLPGGRLMISEYMLRDSPAITDAEGADLQTGCEGWAMPRLLSAAEYRELLAEHGFDKVEAVDPSRNVAPSLRRLGRLVRLLGPTARSTPPSVARRCRTLRRRLIVRRLVRELSLL
jgi:tocopherol O-methyltransferase